MSHHFSRYFTLEEANASIRSIRSVFAAVHHLAHASATKASAYENGLASSNGHGRNGHSAPGQKSAAGFLTKKDAEHAMAILVNWLVDQGIVIQDVGRGLVDFPALLDGREVFLCYELSDGDAIAFYHELDAGFAGRRPVEEGFS